MYKAFLKVTDFILWCDNYYPIFMKKILSNYEATFSVNIVVMIKQLLALDSK